MGFHFADYFEAVARGVPGAPALIHGNRIVTWADYEQRAARLAAALASRGLGAGAKIAVLSHNAPEYCEAQFAAFKLRAVPINVNYRYLEEELAYLLDNADAEAIVVQGALIERIDAVRARLPKLRQVIAFDRAGIDAPWAEDYESLIAASAPLPPAKRPGDDVYMLYTGGTTGLPKGVMYRHDDLLVNLMGGYDIRGTPRPASLVEVERIARGFETGGQLPRCVVACPQMHGTGMWIGTFVTQMLGGAAITLEGAHFDPDTVWRAVERHRASTMVIVGDAFGRPLLAALDAAAARGQPYDLSSLEIITSSGVMWSAEIKQGLLKHKAMMLVDAMGSTEGGMGSQVTTREVKTATAKFALYDGVRVFTDDGRPVLPGSGEIGRLAVSRGTPLGYYKDETKTQQLIKVIDGQRYSFPGDYATVEADGTITLLGRGSLCINTGGEKVFPEEVEEVLKLSPAIEDCLVVGLPDERFGERIVAVVAPRGASAPEEGELIEAARPHLASYKLPRRIVFVPRIERAANGKADYKWAKEAARAALAD